jgi:hypothetical protein
MPKRTRKPDLTEALQDGATTVAALRGVAKLHVCISAGDATGAIQSGAILLGIARIDNDEDGDGFRYLIGLPHGVEVTPYLSNYFHQG